MLSDADASANGTKFSYLACIDTSSCRLVLFNRYTIIGIGSASIPQVESNRDHRLGQAQTRDSRNLVERPMTLHVYNKIKHMILLLLNRYRAPCSYIQIPHALLQIDHPSGPHRLEHLHPRQRSVSSRFPIIFLPLVTLRFLLHHIQRKRFLIHISHLHLHIQRCTWPMYLWRRQSRFIMNMLELDARFGTYVPDRRVISSVDHAMCVDDVHWAVEYELAAQLGEVPGIAERHLGRSFDGGDCLLHDGFSEIVAPVLIGASVCGLPCQAESAVQG